MDILIVGGGSIGERHLRCFGQLPSSKVALCEIDRKKREQIQARYGVEYVYESLDHAISRSWDAAVICTPAHLHVEHAVQLAPVTTAFLIEKPLSTALEDLPRLQHATEGKLVGVAYVRRESPVVQEVKRLIDGGGLGTLLQITGVSGQHFPTYRPAYRETYYTRHETGGGAIQDAMTHSVNLVQWLSGNFETVYCDYAHLSLEDVEVEDTVHLVARSRAGALLVSLTLNQFQAPNDMVIDFNCERGSVRLASPPERYGVMCRGEDEWVWPKVESFETDDYFRLQARNFIDACAGKSFVRCDLNQAEHTLRTCLAALESRGERRIDIV